MGLIETIKIGSNVEWMGSSFEVVEIKKSGLLLKQNFSIGNTLVSTVEIKEVSLIE